MVFPRLFHFWVLYFRFANRFLWIGENRLFALERRFSKNTYFIFSLTVTVLTVFPYLSVTTQ